MNTRTKKVVFIVCLVVCGIFWPLVCAEPPTRMEKSKQLAKAWNQRRIFYGKVVDFDGNPLEDVEITASLTSVTIYGTFDNTKKTFYTDKDGQFKVSFVGYDIHINSVKKEFYEFSRQFNLITSIDYKALKRPEASKDKPMVFRLRKMSVPAYLIGHPNRSQRLSFDWEKDKLGGFDLFWQQDDENGIPRYTSIKRPMNAVRRQLIDSLKPDKKLLEVIMENDILAEGKPLANGQGYEITFKPLDEHTSLLLSDELLYQAPSEGYEPYTKMTFKLSDAKGGDLKKYLYVKGNEGRYYSRVEIGGTLHYEVIYLSFTPYTNPTGSRNLEYNKEYQAYEGKRRLEILIKREKARDEAQNKRVKFDEAKFMEKIRAEQAEADKDKPLKWWDKLKKEEQEKKDKQQKDDLNNQ